MKPIFLYLIFIHLVLGCAQGQSADYTTAFQNTTLEENIQWLQKRLSFTSRSFSDEKTKTRTTAEYDSSAHTLTLYSTNLADHSRKKGVRFFLDKLTPKNVTITQIGRPDPRKEDNYTVYENRITFVVPPGVNGIQIITQEDGQEEIEFNPNSIRINLPEPISQDQKVLEEIVGRLQQTILLLNRK